MLMFVIYFIRLGIDTLIANSLVYFITTSLISETRQGRSAKIYVVVVDIYRMGVSL